MKNFKQIIVTALFTSCFVFASNSIASNYIDEANHYFEKGEYKSAIIQLKNQLRENPEDAEARLLLGQSYLKKSDIRQASKEISRAYKLSPANENIVLAYAQLLLLEKNYKKVNILLKNKLIEGDNENKRQIYKAYTHLGQNQLADAKQIFSELSKSYESAQVYNGLARVAILEKENNEASQWLKKSFKLEPDNVEALQIQVLLVLADNNYKEALSVYNKIIAEQPNNLSLYLKRAQINFRLKELQSAEKDVMLVLKQHKNDPKANFILARIKLQEKKYKESQVAAQNVLNVMPRHFDSMLLLGIANYGVGNYNQADKFLTQYLSTNPDSIKVQNLLANVYLAQKKGDQALLILENIDEETKSNNAKVLMTLGSAYLLTGEYQKGVDALNKAKKLDPESETIQKKLVAGQFKTGDIDNAISGLEKIVDSDKTNNKTKYLLIISYIQKKEIQKAENKLKELIKKTPDDPALYNLTAVVERLKGNHQQAVSAYNQALQHSEKYIPAYMGLAELAIIQKDWKSAKANYYKVLQINPKYIKGYIFLAGIAEKEGNNDEIEKQLKTGMEQSNGSVKSQLSLAYYLSKWYLKQKTPEKILPVAKNLKRNNPNNNAVSSFLAFAQIVNKQSEQAEKTLTTIINNNLSDVKHRLLLAELLLKKKGSEDKVLVLLNSVIDIVPDNQKIVKLKAEYLLKLKKYPQVIEVADYAEKKFPEHALGYQLKGDTYRLQNKFDKALINYQAAYKLQPDNKTLFIISKLLIRQGKEKEALAILNRQLKNNDKDLAIHFQLGNIYQKNKQYNMASNHYSKILSVNPDNVLVLNNLALIYEEENNPQALELASKAYEMKPNSPAIIDTYGYIQVKQGDMAEGLKLLEKAVKLAPEAYDIKSHLAYAYYVNGENKKAKALLEVILSGNSVFSEKENAQMLFNQLQ